MILDIIVAIIVAAGFVMGYKRGLIQTVFDTLSLLVGVLAALKFFPFTMKIVDNVISGNPAISYIVSIVLTFIIVMLLVRFIGKKLEDLFKAVNLNFVNKLAGGALQGLFFALLISFGLYLLDNLRMLDEQAKEKSISYSLLEPLPRHSKTVFEKFKPMFIEFWDTTVDTMDRIKDKAEGTESEVPNTK